MFRSVRRPGITLIEVVVLIFVLGLLLMLLIPANVVMRESARRAACINNMKTLGLALHNHHDAHKRFPGSQDVPFAATPISDWSGLQIREVSTAKLPYGSGFSWLAKIHPYLEEHCLYNFVDFKLPLWDTHVLVTNKETMERRENPCHMCMWVMPVQEFRCPSDADDDFVGPNVRVGQEDPYIEPGGWGNPNTNPFPEVAVTNYVALGASHKSSLFGQPPANDCEGGEHHPNGVICPGEQHSIRDITDGAAHTLVACETRERTLAAWWEGCTAAVYGVRPAAAGDGPLSFAVVDQDDVPDGEFGQPVDATTTLNYGDDKAAKPVFFEERGPGGNKWVHGPSSHHPGLINHLLGDGSVRSVQEGLDARVYMWLITRAGSEPVEKFYELDD